MKVIETWLWYAGLWKKRGNIQSVLNTPFSRGGGMHIDLLW